MEEKIETKEIKQKKKNKTVIILTVILVILLLGVTLYISYSRGMLDIFIKKEIKEDPKQEDLVEGYQFRLKDIECKKEEHACTKELKVAYDGKNHDLKIKYLQRIEEQKDDPSIKHNNLYYQLYIDNELVDQIAAGSLYLEPDSTNDDPEYNMNFDGYIYIFSKKYLGLLFRTQYPAGSGGYSLALYNNQKRIGEPALIDVAGQSFGTNNGNGSLDGIENISFDGSSLKYWILACETPEGYDAETYDEGPNSVAAKVESTFDGTNFTTKYAGERKDVTGGGSSGSSCFSIKDNKIEINEGL